MPRNLTAEQRARLASKHVGQLILFYADTSPEPTRIASAQGGVNWRGVHYESGAGLISITPLSSASDLAAGSLRLRFSYNANSVLDPVLLTTETFLGKRVRMWFCPFDTKYDDVVDDTLPHDPRIIGDPIQILEGRMEEDTIEDNPVEGGAIEFRIVNHLDILTRRSGLIYSDEHQRHLYGEDDRSLQNIADIQDYRYKWGPDNIKL